MDSQRPAGAGQPNGSDRPAAYNRCVIEHVLAVWAWHDWDELLEWLCGDGPGNPCLNPDELRDLRQDAERACRRGERFVNDPDKLLTRLRSHHRIKEGLTGTRMEWTDQTPRAIPEHPVPRGPDPSPDPGPGPLPAPEPHPPEPVPLEPFPKPEPEPEPV